MDIHISIQTIREIVSIIGYVIIGGIFGIGFLWDNRTSEKLGILFVGVICIIGWRFLMKLIFGG